MKSRRSSLRTRLMMMSLTMLALVCVIITTLTYQRVRAGFSADAQERAQGVFNGVTALIEAQEQDTVRCARQIASRPDLIAALANPNKDALKRLAHQIREVEKIDVLTISDAAGIAVARGHSDTVGDSVLSQANVRVALQGKSSHGYEPGSVVKMALRSGQPVLQDGKVIGCITVGINLSSNDNCVDNVLKTFNCHCSVFSGNERISTSMKGPDGTRLKGTKMNNPTVDQLVLKEGKPYLWEQVLNGINYQYALWPLRTPDGVIVGMMGIRLEMSAMAATLGSLLTGMILTGLGALVLTMVVVFFVAKSISGEIDTLSDTISNSSQEVLSAATQVASASHTLAQGVSSEAASLEETGASIEELVGMTKHNAENAEKAAGWAKDARAVADAGGNDMQAMAKAMNDIQRSSDDIAKIIKIIDEIAFQTNILALNAAVEAARAGEAGAGFAVVADEVRSLAHRSAEAAKQTAGQIEAAIQRTKEGGHLSDKVIQCLEALSQKVRSVDELIAEVASASRKQNGELQQLSSAVSSIDRVTQASAANSEETAAAARELTNHANLLTETVSQLQGLVRGR